MRLGKRFSNLSEHWNHLGTSSKFRFLALLLEVLILRVWGEGSETGISYSEAHMVRDLQGSCFGRDEHFDT